MSIKKISENQPKFFEFSGENLIKAEKEVKKYPVDRKASAVLALLYLAQNQNNNWIPLPAIKYISEFLNISYMQVYEVATFTQCLICLRLENILYKFVRRHHV